MQGHTWAGTVTSATPSGAPKLGVEPWVITFDVDHVYADRTEPDVPTPSIEVGQPLALPSNTCGRSGDMGLRPGHRYLVSTSSFGDGTSIGSIVAWEIDGEQLLLAPQMYKTTTIGPQFEAVKTLQEALALVVPQAVPASPDLSNPPPSTPGATASPIGTGASHQGELSSSWVTLGALVVVTGLALSSVAALLARRRGRGDHEGGTDG